MSQGGIPGINNILNTGRVSIKGILIGATTVPAGIMMRIFTTGTIAARAVGGRKEPMVPAKSAPDPVQVRPRLGAGDLALVK
jgi:hypothetical protein